MAELRGVSRETLAALRMFVDLLLRWNRRINLIARGDEARVWSRHVADSLQLVRLMQPCPASGVDIGSGAGFPGLILALATSVPFELIEADRQKASFLREAARLTGAPVTVANLRLPAGLRRDAGLVTARAVAPLSMLLSYAAPLLSPSGYCLFPKGRLVEAELTDAAREWHMRMQRIPSRTEPAGVILRVSEISRA